LGFLLSSSTGTNESTGQKGSLEKEKKSALKKIQKKMRNNIVIYQRAKESTYLHDSLRISVSSKIKKRINRSNSQSLTRRQVARSVVIAIFSLKKSATT
jgi:hypothetical protein